MARSGMTTEVLAQIEALVNVLLVWGDAVLDRGVQPTCDIEFACVEQPQGQTWLSVKTTYECLCCLLDSSYSQQSQDKRKSRRRTLGDRLEALEKVD